MKGRADGTVERALSLMAWPHGRRLVTESVTYFDGVAFQEKAGLTALSKTSAAPSV